MALQSITGAFMFPPTGQGLASALTALTVDATGEALAFIGPVYIPSRSSAKDITRIQFRFGTLTTAGNSGYTLSLQSVLSTSIFPDGTQDQTVAILSTGTGVASNTWYRTDALSANRTVAHGEMLAVVLEFDSSGRLGADIMNVSAISKSGIAFAANYTAATRSSAAAWTVNTTASNNILIEFSDGTYGLLGSNNMPVTTNINNASLLSTATTNEVALRFTIPFSCKIEGIQCGINQNNTTFDVAIYQGTTELGSRSFDGDQTANTFSWGAYYLSSEITLSPDTVYYASIRATSTGTTSVGYFEVSSNSHFGPQTGSSNWYYASRGSTTAAWTDLDTRRPQIGLILSALSDNVGGSGGGFVIGS